MLALNIIMAVDNSIVVEMKAPLYFYYQFKDLQGLELDEWQGVFEDIARRCMNHRKFTIDDFAHEKLLDFFEETDMSEYMDGNGNYNFQNHPVIVRNYPQVNLFISSYQTLKITIEMLNRIIDIYEKDPKSKWIDHIIELLPSSYLLENRIVFQPKVLLNILEAYKNMNPRIRDNLPEWEEFYYALKKIRKYL